MSAVQESASTKKLQLLQKFSLHLLLFFLNIWTETKQASLLLCRKRTIEAFSPQFFIVDMLSVDMLLPPLSLHWTLKFIARHSGALQVPGTPPITVSWMIRGDGHRFERQKVTLPRHFIKPVTWLLFYTFKRLLKRSLWASLELWLPFIAFEWTCVFNGVCFAVVCLVLFFFLSFRKMRACPQCLPRDLNKVWIRDDML